MRRIPALVPVNFLNVYDSRHIASGYCIQASALIGDQSVSYVE